MKIDQVEAHGHFRSNIYFSTTVKSFLISENAVFPIICNLIHIIDGMFTIFRNYFFNDKSHGISLKETHKLLIKTVLLPQFI